MRALPPTLGNGSSCDLERDDDGELMWAQDHDDDESTPLECAGSDQQQEGTYAVSQAWFGIRLRAGAFAGHHSQCFISPLSGVRLRRGLRDRACAA